jgi:hypothetical protein
MCRHHGLSLKTWAQESGVLLSIGPSGHDSLEYGAVHAISFCSLTMDVPTCLALQILLVLFTSLKKIVHGQVRGVVFMGCGQAHLRVPTRPG